MADAQPQPTNRVVLAAGAHKWLVGIGIVLAFLAIAVAAVGRFVGTTLTKNGNTTTTKSWPSDTEFTALLSSGAVLVLSGFLWSRLSAIKLPGGAEIDLNSDEQKGAAQAVADKLQGTTSDPAKVAEETQKAVSALRRAKASAAGIPKTSPLGALSQTDIKAVVDEVVKP